jgi:hypothetical protein
MALTRCRSVVLTDLFSAVTEELGLRSSRYHGDKRDNRWAIAALLLGLDEHLE